MDNKFIIQQGERAKYFVKSNKWNFNFEENGFRLEIIYGMTGQKIVIPKSEFQYLNNRWVFSFPTDDIVGQVKARLVMELFDPDCPDDTREEVDEQYIAFVVTMPCPKFFKSKKCCQQDSDIVYERTEASDIAELYTRLADKDGHRFRNSEGGYMFVLRNL
jgi:hypothetical protein